jgi:hypothetical protein
LCGTLGFIYLYFTVLITRQPVWLQLCPNLQFLSLSIDEGTSGWTMVCAAYLLAGRTSGCIVRIAYVLLCHAGKPLIAYDEPCHGQMGLGGRGGGTHFLYITVLRIQDILVWILICGSMPLTNVSGSGTCYLFSSLTFEMQKNRKILLIRVLFKCTLT